MGAIGIGSPPSRGRAIYGDANGTKASSTSPPATWTAATCRPSPWR